MHSNPLIIKTMKIRNIIYIILSVILLSVTGCVEETNPENAQVNITVRYSELSYNYAVINVKQDGPEDITWYGFLTTEVEKNVFEIFYPEYNRLIQSGEF